MKKILAILAAVLLLAGCDDMKPTVTGTITTTNGTSTYKLSALTYSYNAINSSSTTAEKYNAACALYEYYKAAIAYRS